MEIVRLKMTSLEPNAGQLEGLPVNPRQWSKSDIDLLAKSLSETPELFEARPLLVVPNGDKFVILGGNLRYEASKQNKAKEVPAIVFPANTPIDKLKEIVIKDNGSFGDWDMDALANEWDDLPLTDWGVPAWNPQGPEGSIDIDGLFNQEETAPTKDQPIEVPVCIPQAMADKEDDIRAALLITLEQFPGVYLK